MAGQASSASGSAAATSQTTTAATTATTQAAQTGASTQQAQASLTHSLQALQALQSAQAAARSSALHGANNLGLDPNHVGQTLPNVPNGLVIDSSGNSGLIPGVVGVDPTNPATVATTVPVTANSNGTSSVTLAANSGITLPPSTSGPAQITASGTGVVGTITTGGVITPFTGGVATSVAPGSTISITKTGGDTVTFASSSTGIPATFSTYNYGTSTSMPASWSGIKGLTQSTFSPGSGQADQTTVTVTQTQQQALLTWQSFNIGKNTTLDFDQSQGGANVSQWVAINQIADPSLRPSQILGAIQAPGQVYVINQNGIIFGGSSQINVGALTASSLALNPAYIANGLLNDSGNSYQFQFSSLFTTTTARTGKLGHQVLTTTVAPLWTMPPTVPSGGSLSVSSVPTGDVTVQAGAQLSSATNAGHQGGRIALIAPNVVNDGTISTPDGQTILAAGLQVGFAAHNANDASLRGLDVYVGQVSAPTSTLPIGTSFIFNGLPGAGVPNSTGVNTGMPLSYELTFSGSGQVGTYTAPTAGSTATPIMADTTVAIPVGSTVNLTSGAPSFAAVQNGSAGNVTNGANTLDAHGNIVTPGGDIESPRAAVTMIGETVNQLGIINGSTSVTLNGRIDLLADYNTGTGLSAGVTSFYPLATGVVNLGGQSVTQILPELTSTETTIGTTLPVSSLINVQGLDINMLPGSLVLAPGANTPSSTSSAALDMIGTKLTSGVNFNAGTWFASGSQPGAQTSSFSNDTGQISLGVGAIIDVSGSKDVNASVTEDIIPVQLRGPELADSPLQQNGALRGQTVYIDIRQTGVYNGTSWIGTPIGDVSGYVNNVQRTVGELTTAGGTVTLNAGTSVNIGTGASINVSGGWINYAGANVQTTQVVSNGRILDISQATPNLVYQGIYTGYTTTSEKWGVSQTTANLLLSGSRYEAGYIQGGNGGAIAIAAPAMALSGNLYGNTVAGSFQRTPAATLNSTYSGATFLPTTLAISAMPQASELDISFLQHVSRGVPQLYPATSPDVLFETDSFISQATSSSANQVLLSQDLINNDGFGTLVIDTTASGKITVPQGVSLTTVPGGLISFAAANIDIEGSISAPAGGLNFTVTDVSPTAPFLLATPVPDPTRGQFMLGSGSSLSASGLLVNNGPNSSTAGTLPFATSGGTISIAALDIDLEQGSTIDVSGGVVLNSSGQQAFGKAGSISILGGRDPGVPSLVAGSQLFLGSTLTGYSGKAGGAGSLTIQAPLVQIGGSSLLNGDSSSQAMVAGESSVMGNGTTLWLNKSAGPNQASTTDFFSQGGFGSFTIEGLGQIETDSSGAYLFNAAGNPIISPAVLIAANTIIKPVVQSLTVTTVGNNVVLAPLGLAQTSQLLPSQRSPVNLVFNAEGVNSSFAQDGPPEADGTTFLNGGGGGGVLVRGDLVVQSGATIQTDPQTNSAHGVSLLASHGTVAILGSVIAPGGTISVTGGDTTGVSSNMLLFFDSTGDHPFATVDLGPGSVLSTAGATEQTYNSFGYKTGSVLAGGNVTIGGNIVAEQGSTIDVSGASDVLNELPSALSQAPVQLGASPYVPTLVESNGGTVTLKAAQLLYEDGTLLGAAGGAMAQGGNLSVSSGYAVTSNPNAPVSTPQDVTLIVSQQGLNGGFSLPANAATGLALVDGQVIPSSSSDVGTSINSSVGGEPVYSYFVANPNLFVSSTLDTSASNNGGKAGGFANLNLAGTLGFIGPVSITTSNSLSVAMSSGNAAKGESGGVIYGSANAPIVLTSPYVSLNSYQTSLQPDLFDASVYPGALTGPGSLVVNASTLADVGNLSLQNIGTLTFNSLPNQAGDIRGVGTLQVAGQINLNAAQIYPPTESTFTIKANDVSITAPTNQPLPSLPLSAGGTLNIVADTIEQSGVLRAPFGVINLGTSATQNITLSAGSITSVSAVDPNTGKGITIPYGLVDANGNWYDPQGNNITLAGPPSKAVNVTSQNVDILSGSTIDLRGGGDLYAYQFVAGTGGNQDILASTGDTASSTSFAILPGYSLNYAPDGTYAQNDNLQANNSADAGYFNSNLVVGEQVYLNASNGLAAGYYTLLPARYALLPGAFLVSPTSGGAPGASVAQSDGSSLVSGYVTNGLNHGSSLVYSGFELDSQATVLTKAPYTINLANTFFAQNAAKNNLTAPLLPNDSGQLVLDATQTMSIQGTLLSQPGADGIGGQVDIASPEDIYIVGPTQGANVPTGALILDSSQLTEFGAASLLIGGYRTTTASGTSVTVTTNNLVVDNSGASTNINGMTVAGLAAPDITLVSNTTLTVTDGAVIEQLGQLPGKAQTLTLKGNGALLRISSDSSAQTIRQNVTLPDSTSVLSIGQGARILNANGGAVGTLNLDSTSLVTISTSTIAAPVLSGNTLILDSGFINLELGTPTTAPTTGLVITEPQLQSLLASTKSLSFLSYSSIAVYGNGEIGGVTVDASGQKTYQESSLALHASDIYYADTQGSAGITINAQTVSLDNLSGGSTLPSLTGLGASNMTINAQTITLGSNAMRMDQFNTVALNADGAILLKGLGAQVAGSDNAPTPASLNVNGNLVLTTPLITGATTADRSVTATTTAILDETITAAGTVVIQAPQNNSVAAVSPNGLAASLSLIGSSVTQNSGSIVLHSGSVDLQATGPTSEGNILVNGTVDVSGVASTLYSLTKYTNGGQVVLGSLNGNVVLGSGGLIDVSAASGSGTVDSGAGSGGSVVITAAGTFTPGQIKGQAGVVTQTDSSTVLAQGIGGTFSLDVGSLDASGSGEGLLSSLESGLAGFTQQNIRDRNDGTVTVDGTVKVNSLVLSADRGSIHVTGAIDASNVLSTDPVLETPIYVGGSIDLAAGGSVVLSSTAVLNASGQNFDNAGQGGTVTLEAGSYEGVSPSTSRAAINLMAGSQIDLSVGGGMGGTLHLRAPQVTGGSYVSGSSYTPVAVNAANGGSPTDVAIAPIAGNIVQNASSIIVEGFYVQDAQQANAFIDNYETAAENNATAFMANASTIQTRLFGSTTTNIHVRPGEEIDNSGGSLELQNTWDLSTLRYGAALVDSLGNTVTNVIGNTVFSEPGVLTLRAAGNLNVDFGASLTDGFDGSAGVNFENVLMPVGSQSWSYRLTSGADFNAANANAVQTAAVLLASGSGGSLQVGYQNTTSPITLSIFTTNDINQFFQTIRTGTGSITANSGGDVLLLNNLATIYTAGMQVDSTLGGAFVPPSGTDANGLPLPATYSRGGGNVTISAQGNIAHESYNGTQLVADSSAEMPTNWLDREGNSSAGIPTTWWVDFTNFFEGVGALGGGNVTLSAAGSIINVDAAVPTNARLVNGQLNELGGGDITLRAGNNIDGGVYYMERGQGMLTAANNIQTNATRTAVGIGQPSTSIDWLPTTLFLGKGSFSLAAGGNLLLGPVANPFLLPQSYNNIAAQNDTTSELSYFSTYASTDAINASSLAGSVTIQSRADSGGQGSIAAWYSNVLDSAVINSSLGDEVSAAEPWLFLAEATNPAQVASELNPANHPLLGSPANVFGGVSSLLPPTLRATAFSNDINLIGNLTLSPSSSGTVDLVAAGSVNAFQVNSVITAGSLVSPFEASALINLSDADPNSLPSVTSPLTAGTQLINLSPFFTVTGASEGLTLQARQRLHADINGESLHANDLNPVYIYAGTGDISGLNLFSSKTAQVIAGQDITDVGLYIQNNNAQDISLIDAGRDIIAYDATSILRQQAGFNILGYNPQLNPLGVGSGAPNSGDIQISGPGTLEVLAGRNLTLGNDVGQNPSNTVSGDGLFSGLTSVGGQLNPALPFGGANIVAAAGLGSSLPTTVGLQNSSLSFSSFITQFLDPASAYASTYLPDLASMLSLSNSSDQEVWNAFEKLPVSQQDNLALDIFYLVLRDAGRNHNNSDSPGFGNYHAADQAIAALMPASSSVHGDINLTSREVKTSNGGDINLLAPGGQVIVGVNLPSGQAVDQGILTVDGGNISIFTNNDVSVGTSRIFTLHGGNEIIWSTVGNIAAGASSKTVVSAPPTRVVVDPTSGSVQTDLAGLATGGGIGVLAAVAGAAPSDVDLIAPLGIIDAGDAGIRASGNLNIAALKVVNADNISVGGKSSGVPATASVNIGAAVAASSAAGSSTAAASNGTPGGNQHVADNAQDLPSIISVEVLGYGGGDQD